MRLRIIGIFILFIVSIHPAFAVEDTLIDATQTLDEIQLEIQKEKEPITPHISIGIDKEHHLEKLIENGISLKLEGKIIKEIRFGGAFQGELDFDMYQGESGGHVQYTIPVGDIYVQTKFADEHESEAKFMVNPARHLDFGNYFTGMLQDVYFATKPTENTRLLIGNSRTPIGIEGGQSAYTLPLVFRSQIARTYGDVRELGIKHTGEYKWADYNIGIYDSSRYFYDMFKGAEFTGWVNFKPFANLDEEKYGSLKIGTGLNVGKRYNSYTVWSTGLEYKYKKLTLAAEYGFANGYNGKINSSDKSDGFNTTISYRIHPKVELVGRYDIFNPNKDERNNHRTELSTGINYFILGEKLLLVLNYVFRMYQDEQNSHGLYFVTQLLI